MEQLLTPFIRTETIESVSDCAKLTWARTQEVVGTFLQYGTLHSVKKWVICVQCERVQRAREKTHETMQS